MAPEVQDPKKMLKIVSYAETEKMKETMVGPQVEYAGDHQYPPRSLIYLFGFVLSMWDQDLYISLIYPS